MGEHGIDDAIVFRMNYDKDYSPDYVNGFLERVDDGSYQGRLVISGVDISPIIGVYFKKGGCGYLWLKRKRIMEYDTETKMFSEREALPQWEAYLKKETTNNAVAYKGEFFFLRFRFSIVGLWDNVLGGGNTRRLNLVVEKMKMGEQTIINKINERKHNDGRKNNG